MDLSEAEQAAPIRPSGTFPRLRGKDESSGFARKSLNLP